MASTSNIVPRLVVIEGKEKGKVIQLKPGTAVLGRSKGDILIQDPRISRSHVAIHFDSKAGTLSCTDLKSLNGTLVNGETITTGELRDGDKLQLGDTLIDCQIGPIEETLASYHVTKEPSRQKESPREPEAVLLESLEPEAPAPQPPSRAEASSAAPKRERIEEKSLFKNLYLKMPKPVRIAVLGLTVVFVYLATLDPSSKLSSEGIEREITSIRNLETEGRVEEALSKAEKVAKQFPENPHAFLVLGDLYAAQNKREQAIAAYRKAHQLKSPPTLVHLRLIRQYLRTGFSKEGMEEFKHIEMVLKEGQETQHTKEIFIETANLFLEFKDELKQPPEKMFIIAKALQNTIAPDRAIGFKLEAEIYFQQSRYPEAIEVLERGLKLEPKDEGTLNALVKAKIFSKDMAGAQKVIDSWMQVAPLATRPLIVAAFLRFNEKNYLGALPYLQKVVQLLAKTPQEPDYGQALHNMGLIYYEQNQLTEAENSLRQACDLGINDSCTHPLLKPAEPNAVKEPASLPPQNGSQNHAPAPTQAPSQPAPRE